VTATPIRARTFCLFVFPFPSLPIFSSFFSLLSSLFFLLSSFFSLLSSLFSLLSGF